MCFGRILQKNDLMTKVEDRCLLMIDQFGYLKSSN